MGDLSAYVFLSVNGRYKGPGEDIAWHHHGEEEARYSAEALAGDTTLLFGRRTYEMMAAFWPTPMAAQQLPEVAAGMNRATKVVFSRTPFTPDWSGARCASGDVVDEVRDLKDDGGRLTVLGSGSIVSVLAEHDLLDRLEIMIDPIAIGRGTALFHEIERPLPLQLADYRVFGSGAVLLTYTPRR